ncbi:MAG: tetratricopeptide repeat protein [Bacteroidales bacterium]|nr:MAG: tetratricopeptide repeat protein [Bacteroidales bacterium]
MNYSGRIKDLKKKLSDLTDPSERIDILNQLAWLSRYEDTKEAKKLAEEALDLSVKNRYSRGKAYASLYKAVAQYVLSSETALIKDFLDVHDYFAKHEKEAGFTVCLRFLALVNESNGNYEKGIEYAEKAVKQAQRNNDREGEGDAFSTLGIIQSRLSDFKPALESCHKSLEIRKELNNTKAAASSLNLIARIHSLGDEYDKAMDFYRQSLDLRTRIRDRSGLPWTHLGMASLLEKTGDLEEALYHYRQGLILDKPIGEKRCELQCVLGEGRVYIRLGELQKGYDSLQRALNMSMEMDAKPLISETHLALAEYYEKCGKYDEALKHFKNYQQLDKQVLNAKTRNRLKDLQIANAIEQSKKEAEIYQLRNVELKEAYDEIQSQRDELESALESLKQTQKQLIESEKMAALGGMVVGIAHEINTPVGIGITAASTLSEEIEQVGELYRSGQISKKRFEEYLNTAKETAGLILSNMNRAAGIIQSFKQVSADQATEERRKFKIKNYLEDLIKSLTPKLKNKPVRISLNMDENIEMDSYPGSFSQVFTNLILNSIEHGIRKVKKNRLQIEISAERMDKSVILDYQDDGTGIAGENMPRIFDPFFTTNKKIGTGLGLNIVYNLVTRKLQGTIHCESEPGKGVLFRITIPVIAQ